MIYFSVCSRKDNPPKALERLKAFIRDNDDFRLKVAYDSKSIYEGHRDNLEQFRRIYGLLNTDIIVLLHDDVDILSNAQDVRRYLSVLRNPLVGFVGVAGGCWLPPQGWWVSRNSGEARGFVFQGDNAETMSPNYFGPAGQVLILDGCFLATTYKTLQDILGLYQPAYLTSPWDWYDMFWTYEAYLKGYNNYTVPIIIRHESSGIMRKPWYDSNEEFRKHHIDTLKYAKLDIAKTTGLP